MKKKIVILISGNGSNMLRIIEEAQGGILRSLCKVCAVISNKEDARGLRSAFSKDVPALALSSQGKSREEFERDLLAKVQQWSPDYIVLAGFMRILSPWFIEKFPRRIINIHRADTREHQGLAGYLWAFENKLKSTKITVHFVDESLDRGEIIDQVAVNLDGCQTSEEVTKRGLEVEHRFYSQVLRRLFSEEHVCAES